MKIAQVYNGTLPPKGYGGGSRVVYWLALALKSLGHDIVVIARSDEEHFKSLGIGFKIWHGDYSQINSLLDEDTDIVHFHSQFDATYLPNYPYIVTQHGNHRNRSSILPNTIFISKSQAWNHCADYYVYNGIPTTEYPLYQGDRNNLLFMALVRWRKKNVKTAINLAMDTKTTIDICGGDIWNEKRISGLWKVKARSSDNKRYLNVLGEVDGSEKLSLLKKSCLLFYIVNWHEPFALAPHEALSCGTPVLSGPNGALTEYIKDGENGYIVNDYQEAISTINKHNKLSDNDKVQMAIRCRESAFTIEDSANSYIEAYNKIITKEYLYTDKQLKKIKYRRNKVIKITKPLSQSLPDVFLSTLSKNKK